MRQDFMTVSEKSEKYYATLNKPSFSETDIENAFHTIFGQGDQVVWTAPPWQFHGLQPPRFGGKASYASS